MRAQEVAALDEVAASAGDDAEMRSLAEEARSARSKHSTARCAVRCTNA